MAGIKKIIKDVKQNGDAAVRKYTVDFDKLKIRDLAVSEEEIRTAYKKMDKTDFDIIKKSAVNVKVFARTQFKQFKNFEYTKKGVTLGQRVVPIEKIGVYVPGGQYPLVSTVLMCVIPAKMAGVKNVVVCSPKIKPETITAAHFAGADSIYRIGGVQAIAAMAYGTESVPKVDKVVGPGNTYVVQAKKEIYGDCGIDFLAGPSEILIIADSKANASFIAADLLAQAEHDTQAVIILISDSPELIQKVEKELRRQLVDMENQDIIKIPLANKKIIKVKNIKEAIGLANNLAPEHLSLQVRNPKSFLPELKNYGSLFLGDYSAVAFGDYCSGTNHVLPTNKASRYTGGLSVKDFVKIQTYQYITKEGAKDLAQTAADFAVMEGLDAHAKSARARFS